MLDYPTWLLTSQRLEISRFPGLTNCRQYDCASVQIDTNVPHGFPPRLVGYGLDIKTVYEALPGPRALVVVPPITQFHVYIDEANESGSNAAPAWFQEQLKK